MILKASPNEIKDAGKVLVEKAENYIGEVKEIYNTVDNLGNSWQGKDNADFVSTVYSYRDNITALGQVIGNYGVFLQETANSLTKLQAEIAQTATKL